MELSEKTEQDRQRLKETLDANPDLKKAFKEALEKTKEHFQKPEVISEMASMINKTKEAFESGKFKVIVQEYRDKNGLPADAKLTDEMRRNLAELLTDAILGKK
jgi:ferric iron reductase protein FhuF